MATVYVGLGSNRNQPLMRVRSALLELDRVPSTVVRDQSSLYRTEPIGPGRQPHYINAVAKLQTSLAPLSLLNELQKIEHRHGRRRYRRRWLTRSLDLDLLLYDRQMLRGRRLRVPHPELHRRGFVLLPLSELDPDLIVPGSGRVRWLLSRVDQTRLERIPV